MRALSLQRAPAVAAACAEIAIWSLNAAAAGAALAQLSVLQVLALQSAVPSPSSLSFVPCAATHLRNAARSAGA